jgi:hypothetical protein
MLDRFTGLGEIENGVHMLDFGRRCGYFWGGKLMSSWSVEPVEEMLMPLTKKGTKIKSAMKKTYGAKKGTSVFYASANKGTIKGVEPKKRRK